MTDLDLVNASADCYDPRARWERGWDIDGVLMCYRDGILAFRGSSTPEDWIRDLDAFPSYELGLGFVQSGFMDGMSAVFDAWRSTYPDVRPWITGHSLGGAHAALMTGLLLDDRAPRPQGLVTFGAPRPGFYKLRRLLRSGDFPMRGYAIAGDPVPDLPPFVARIFPYVHPELPIGLNYVSPDGDTSPFAAHRVKAYVDALEAKIG